MLSLKTRISVVKVGFLVYRGPGKYLLLNVGLLLFQPQPSESVNNARLAAGP